MQALHQGQGAPPPGTLGPALPAQVSQDPRKRSQDTAVADAPIPTANADDLTASAASGERDTKRQAEEDVAPAPEKKARKTKDAPAALQMVYGDNDVGPEEKMARLAKYAFDPTQHEDEPPLGPVEASVTGPVVGQDDLIDTTN